jgi:hypothetical protein
MTALSVMSRRLCRGGVLGILLLVGSRLTSTLVDARSSAQPFARETLTLQAPTKPAQDALLSASVRGGATGVARSTSLPRKKTAAPAVSKTAHGPAASQPQQQHHGELMSSSTAIANVLADLCPHGMLPIAFGMAAGGATGPVLATMILFVFGLLSWYSLVSFAR